MNLNQLRVFAAVAREQSITKAAKTLKISQPAVSKQLSELEEAIGTTLVDRLPRGIRLTEAGSVLEEHARRIFQSEAAAEAQLQQLLGLGRGRLSVGASTTIGNYLIPDLFGRFHKAYPRVELQLQIANTAEIQRLVKEDELDLGLTEGFAEAEGLQVQVVAHDEMVMIVAPHSPLAKKGSIGSSALSGLPLLVREEGSGTRDVIEAALAERGVELLPAMSLGSTEALKQAVASGLGAAIVSKLAVEIELQAGVLATVEVTDLKIRRALHLLTLKGKTPSPAGAAFIELIAGMRGRGARP
ncbi:MAG TPA: LysR substrate-binding domain-containing protein [Polyangiaceae bacterium]|nr:LysR substrate-binding domain-containing protein [Polyangiaceae bacterium]